ncbi:DUF4359 domain-containing protein [Lyngbya sp. CCY1209]|uniref:DUF4359 domain-containing protein n=1 Tax=Lyngbya sp. CCY1209 TaxID=2886103 RepID=UPI002D214CA7|nr:DUF4359 domain-containing protein [Lyngbya sp. CCY1209]MEB3882943.1 DUF4359 domain-containing protein [Lyngbya sp. CCY1209]
MMKVDRVKSNHHGGGYIGKGAILLAILAGTMTFTNPSREEYLDYASVYASKELKTSACQESKVPEVLQGFSDLYVDVCSTFATSQRGTFRSFIDNSTHRKNAIFLSIYTSELFEHRYQTIGVFGNFLTFSGEKIPENSVN